MSNPIIEYCKGKSVADLQAFPLNGVMVNGTMSPNATSLVQDNRSQIESGGASGRTPLMWAALQHSQNLVYALLMAGADANKRSNSGKTALDEITATYMCAKPLKDDYIRYTLNERMKNPNSPIYEYAEVYDNGKKYIGGDLVSYTLPTKETKTYRLNATIGAAGYVPFGKYLNNWTEVQFSGPVYGPPTPRDQGCAPPALSQASGPVPAVSGVIGGARRRRNRMSKRSKAKRSRSKRSRAKRV
jgi:Ankyrin repeats (many copies)